MNEVKKGAGRNKLPEDERRVTLRLYPPQYVITDCGGEEKVKRWLMAKLEELHASKTSLK